MALRQLVHSTCRSLDWLVKDALVIHGGQGKSTSYLASAETLLRPADEGGRDHLRQYHH